MGIFRCEFGWRVSECVRMGVCMRVCVSVCVLCLSVSVCVCRGGGARTGG